MKTTLSCYFALLITLIGFTACDEGQQMMKPALTPIVQDPTDPTQAPTFSPEASQPLTKRDKLTHAIYTSEKLWNAYNSGRFELLGSGLPVAHFLSEISVKFEPRIAGTSSIVANSTRFYLKITIVVKNIEYKNACAWSDEFGNLHANFKDDPDFSPPVRFQLIDKTTHAVVNTSKFSGWATNTNVFDEKGKLVEYQVPLDEHGMEIPKKERCKSDNTEVILTSKGAVRIGNLTPETWENRFQLIDAVIEKLKIRIHLEDGSFFDYDFKELFPNPPTSRYR